MEDPIKIAYVIAAHKNPLQLSRLISRLDGDHADFYIHIDKKVSLTSFKKALKSISPDRINFLKQYNATWSEYGIIKAELEALRNIIKANKNHDFIVLLSGQDYPIKSNEYIKAFFYKNKVHSFMEHFPMPFAPWPNGGMDRVERYHFKLLGKKLAYPPYKIPRDKLEIIAYRMMGLFFSERKLPLEMKPYGGEHWWNFNMDVAKFILEFLDDHPEYYNFHRYSFCADEMFFQTLLLNCTNFKIKNLIINNDLRYYDWSEGKDSPKTLKMEDLDKLIESDKLFARKFNSKIDEKVLDELDRLYYNSSNK
jgi:hypothetical protein